MTIEYTEAERKEAVKTIADFVRQAEACLANAENLSDKFGLGFSWGGPAYGMGGYYTPRDPNHPAVEDWERSDGWQASSQSC